VVGVVKVLLLYSLGLNRVYNCLLLLLDQMAVFPWSADIFFFIRRIIIIIIIIIFLNQQQHISTQLISVVCADS